MNVLARLKVFYKKFKGQKQIIGKTSKGSNIYAFTVCKSDYPTVIMTYGIHAREYITTYLALKQIADFERYGERGKVIFLPAVNPDGIKISLTKNPLYKANARGVDLNVNFDARWGEGSQNVFVKGSQNYVGKFPFSENETRALRDLTLKVNPDITVSYHSKGEEIYWQFFQDEEREKRDYRYAKAVSDCTGYPLVTVLNSAGGYKDWCIEKLKIPALTIEVGSDNLSHPIKKEHLEEIYQRNKEVIFTLTESFACKKNL